MLTFYGYKKCSTCRKAEKKLESMKVAYKFIDITESAPSQTLLKKALKFVDGLRPLFNTSGVQYKELKMKDKLPGMTEASALKVLSGNGRLVKRPIVTDGKNVTVGFKEDAFTKTWK